MSFQPAFITANDVDVPSSIVNGARFQAKHSDAVDVYAAAMRRGDSFPCLIVVKKPAGYVILNGNQRFAAIQNLINDGFFKPDVAIGVLAIPPDTDALSLECILKSANATNGVPSSFDERIQHAIALVDKGVTIDEASRIHLVSRAALQSHVIAKRERRLLNEKGIRTELLNRSTLEAISKLGIDESSKVRVAKIATQRELKVDEVKAIVAKTLDAKSLEQRLEVLKAIEDDSQRQEAALKKAPAGSLSPTRHRRDKFIRSLDSLVMLLEAGNNGDPMASVDDLQLSGKSDLMRAKELAARLWNRLSLLGIAK